MPGLSELMDLLQSKLSYSLEIRLNKVISASLTQTITFKYYVLGRIFISFRIFCPFFKERSNQLIYLNVYIDMHYLKNDDYLLVSE